MIGTARQIIRWLTDVTDEKKEFEVKEHHVKRTLNQNSYYWQLETQTANALRMSKTELHNRMLRDFGQLLIIDGQAARCMLPDTEETEKQVLSKETVHLKPTSQVVTMGDGKDYRTYCILRGSHDYSTKEMAILLDGLIQEAQQQGIETLPPHELQKMREYEAKLESRRKARQTAQEGRKGA